MFPVVVPWHPLLLYYLVGISEGHVLYWSKIQNRSGLGACVSKTCMMWYPDIYDVDYS